jgi:hypothetical protein
LENEVDEQALNEKYPGRMVYREGDLIIVKIPVRFRRRNGRQMIFAAGDVGASKSKSEDNALALAIARAWKWQEELESGQYASLEDLAHSKGVDRSYVGRIIRLAWLEPIVVEGTLVGECEVRLREVV